MKTKTAAASRKTTAPLRRKAPAPPRKPPPPPPPRPDRPLPFPGELTEALRRGGVSLEPEALVTMGFAALRKKLEAAATAGLVPATALALLEEQRPALAQLQAEVAPLPWVVKQAGLSISPALLGKLAGGGVQTLDGWRKAGGLARLAPSLGLDTDDEGLQGLDGLARLSLLGGEVQDSLPIVAAGYSDVAAIARTPMTQFLARTEGRLPAEQARALHDVAAAQTALLEQALTEERLRSNQEEGSTVVEAFQVKSCACEACQDALSPMAYLADLLDYTVRNVHSGGNPLTLTDLQARFHQPFRDLPLACEQMDKLVPHARIAVEILRAHSGYYGPLPQHTTAAYLRLLDAIGTSYDELRAVVRRTAGSRTALAHRLMLPDPTLLDRLFFDPGATAGQPLALNETDLVGIFGWRDSAAPPLAADPTLPLLLRWRQAFLHGEWQAQEAAADRPLRSLPVVDPDVVGTEDVDLTAVTAHNPRLGVPKTEWTVLDFLDERRGTLSTLYNDLRSQIPGPSNQWPTQLQALLTALQNPAVLQLNATGLEGITFPLLIYWRKARQDGGDIAADLAAVKLTVPELDALGTVAQLAAIQAPILADEWSDFFEVLVDRIKRFGYYPLWIQEEAAARIPAFGNSPGITLSPVHFRPRPSTAPGWFPGRFRASESARRRWEDLLDTRTEEWNGLPEALAAAREQVEGTLLLDMRNELLRRAGSISPARVKVLTDRYQFDFETTADFKTTRVAQAIQTVQGILFGIRNGLLDDLGLAIEDQQFDREWDWLGAYSSWRAAMAVFLYPENALRPTLRRRASPAFTALIDELRALDDVEPRALAAPLRTYAEYFADISDLTPIGIRLTNGLLQAGVAASTTTPWWQRKDVLAIARSGVSGKAYHSVWEERPGYGLTGSPDQTFWTEVKDLPAKAELLGLLSQRGSKGEPIVGLCCRDRADGKYQYYYARFQEDEEVKAEKVDPFPGLMCVSSGTGGVIPVPRERQGLPPWSSHADDQLCAADIDGDGRDEVLIFAGAVENNGTRRVGLCRESTGGLRLDLATFLPKGWVLPDPKRPLVLGGGRVLVVNTDSNQIGVVRLANQSLSVVGVAGLGALLGASFASYRGAANLPMKFFSLGNAGLVFVAAYGAGDDPESPLGTGMAPVGTFLAVLSFANDQFTTKTAITEFKLSQSANAGFNHATVQPHSVRCETLVPVQKFFSSSATSSSVTHDLLFFLQRDEADVVSSGHMTNHVVVPRLHVGVLAWKDPGFTIIAGFDPYGDLAEAIPASSGDPWTMADDDLFVSARLQPFSASYSGKFYAEIIVFNLAAKKMGLVAYLTSGGLKVTSTVKDRLEPAAPDGEGWPFGPGDRLITVPFPERNIERLYLLNADERRMAELVIDASGQLRVGERWNSRVPFPGDNIAGWPLEGTSHLLSANLDGDGATEVLAFSVTAGTSNHGVLKGMPDPFGGTSGQGLPTRYGPSGITVTDLADLPERGSPERTQAIANAYAPNLIPGPDVNLIYLDEAYYFLVMEVGLRLRQSGHYEEALDCFRLAYDYARPAGQRIATYKLILDQGLPDYTRSAGWLLDPLDPHGIAQVRRGAYLRFTLLSIVSCLLDFADAEFSRATAESLPRARELYLRALDLLDDPALKPAASACDRIIGDFVVTIGEGETRIVFQALLDLIEEAGISASELTRALKAIEPVLSSDLPAGEKYRQGRQRLDDGGWLARRERTVAADLDQAGEKRAQAHSLLIADDRVATALRTTAGALRAASAESPLVALAMVRGDDVQDLAFDRLRGRYQVEYVPAPSLSFCIPPNPVVEALRSRAALALAKLRAGRNIAGLLMTVEPFERPTAAQAGTGFGAGDSLPVASSQKLKPLPYRYGLVVERTKQMIEIARQMEASMLSSLQTADQLRYEELKARQDLALAVSTSQLKELQLVEAGDEVALSELQRDRTQLHLEQINDLIRRGTSPSEDMALGLQAGAAMLKTMSATSSIAAAATAWIHLDFGESDAANAFSSMADAASTLATVASTSASYERRAEEWQRESALTAQDLAIGAQQVRLSQDRLHFLEQEGRLSRVQVARAEEMLDFLVKRRFGTADLFEWMSAILQSVYRYFLQQATSMAKQAEVQLAFERQEAPAGIIKDDYWEKPGTNMTPDFNSPSRDDNVKGLTGSARLLRDLWALDQYAFKKNQRKLQLVETISLSQLDPFAFQGFRDTGILYFRTPQTYFDRRFPGHYLRLIKRVRVSLVALVPPGQGIRATLSTIGTSRVVIGGDVFQEVSVQRGPEMLALSSPQGSTGTFELDPQPELLATFEGIGVDGAWALEMAKGANPFDYRSIADVLFTIEYTALNSFDYREQVLTEMDRRVSADRAFSFRNDFVDAWYDLHNPSDPSQATPFEVTFRTGRFDFPANLESVALSELVLYFVPKEGQHFQVKVDEFVFQPDGGGAAVPALASDSTITINDGGVISTRRGVWSFFKGLGEPSGSWRLKLPGSVKPLFAADAVDDILLVISYRARLPRWPS